MREIEIECDPQPEVIDYDGTNLLYWVQGNIVPCPFWIMRRHLLENCPHKPGDVIETTAGAATVRYVDVGLRDSVWVWKLDIKGVEK